MLERTAHNFVVVRFATRKARIDTRGWRLKGTEGRGQWIRDGKCPRWP